MQHNLPLDKLCLLEQIIHRHPLIVTPETPLVEAIALMGEAQSCSCCLPGGNTALEDEMTSTQEHEGYVLVMANSQLLGIFTERDVVRLAASGGIREELAVAEVISPPGMTLKANQFQDVFTTLNLLRRHRIQHLPIVDEQGGLEGIITLSRLLELSQHQVSQLEARLQTNEQFLHSIYDGTASAIFIVDVLPEEGFRFVGLNAAHEQLIGVRSEDVQGKLLEQVLPPAIAATISANYAQCVQAGTTISYEEWGGDRWWLTTLTPLRDSQSQIYRLIGSSINITQRKQAEAALRKSEAANRVLLEAIPDLLIRMTRDGTYFDVIPAKDFSTFLPVTDMLGKNVREVLPPELAKVRMRYVEQALETGNTQIYEFDLLLDDKVRSQEARIVVSGEDEVLIMVRDISDRKRTETVLAASEAKWRSLIQNSSDIVSIKNREGIIQYMSPSVERIMGYQPEELLGRVGFEFMHPDDLPGVLQAFEQGVSQPLVIFHLEHRVRHKDGSWRLLESTCSNLLTEPFIQGIVFNSRDITERKQAEQKIRFQARLLDTVEQSVVAIDLEGNIIYWNHYAEVLYGWCAADVLGRPAADVLLDETTKEQAAEILSCLQQGESWSGEFLVQRRNGTNFPVMVIDSPIHDEQGRLIGIIGVSVDITERKRTEEALRESEERFRLLSTCSPVGIYMATPEGDWTWTNPRLQAIAGFTFEEALQAGWQQFVHPDDRERLLSEWQNYLSDNHSCLREYRFQHKDGNIRWVRVTSASMFADTGERIGLMGAIEDITERKQAELERQRATDALERLNQELEARVERRTAQLQQTNEQLQAEIAERQRMEAALRESEERFRRIFDDAPIGISLANSLDYRFIMVNPAFCQLLGYTELELTAHSCPAISDLDDLAQEQLYAEQMLRGEISSYQMEKRYIRKNRQIVWGSLRTTAIRNQAGEIVYALGMVEDITKRKQSEQALQQQVERERLMGATLGRIRQSLNLDQILNTTVAEVRQFLQTDRVIIYRFEPDWSGIVIVESVSPEWTPMLGRKLLDACLAVETCIEPYTKGRIQAVEDIYTSGLVDCYIDLLASFQVRANLVVPILQGEQLWGMLIAQHCAAPRQWLPWEIELLTSLATQLAIAIQQSELYGQLQIELQRSQNAEETIKASLNEKELLLKEVHHRVKNNLQVISSIFSLQSQYIEDPQILSILADSQNRVSSMALIHEKLYQSHSLAKIDFAEYVQSLICNLFSSYNINSHLIHLKLQVSDVSLNLDTAIPCGLLINELVSNSLKHAFPEQQPGEIGINLSVSQGQVCLTVQDSGIGLPKGLDLQHTNSLGLRLVRALTRQLKGKLEMYNHNGAVFEIAFPKRENTSGSIETVNS